MPVAPQTAYLYSDLTVSGYQWSLFKTGKKGDAWGAQSFEHLTLAQVMISRFVGSSPASGSVLMAQSLEPASDSVSPSLSAPPLLALSLSQK